MPGVKEPAVRALDDGPIGKDAAREKLLVWWGTAGSPREVPRSRDHADPAEALDEE